jgi:hypothetical protein
MATAAKFVQLIPIVLTYLVPLDVDVLLSLFFHTFLSARFLGDALIKLDETL